MTNLEEVKSEDDKTVEANQKAEEASRNKLAGQCMDVFFGILAIFLSGLLVYWSFSPYGNILFAWHQALTSIGLILFMTEAISVYNYSMLLGRSDQAYSNRVLAHWVLNCFALMFITAGFAVVVYIDFRAGDYRFESTHAIFGLITTILMFIVAVGGIATKYSFKLRHRISPILQKVTHDLFGLVVYWLGGVTLVLGMYTNWFQTNRSYPNVDTYFSFAAIVVIWLYASWRPITLGFGRLRQMCTI